MHVSPPRCTRLRGKWKAVRHGLDKPVELYDLEKDPGEATELSESFPEVRKGFVDMFEGIKGR